ncbi:MAG: hypothetical protein WDN47_04670 [Candidatus Doudnabacteria bacterium]
MNILTFTVDNLRSDSNEDFDNGIDLPGVLWVGIHTGFIEIAYDPQFGTTKEQLLVAIEKMGYHCYFVSDIFKTEK